MLALIEVKDIMPFLAFGAMFPVTVVPAVEGGGGHPDPGQGPAHRQMRPFDQPDDLELLGGGKRAGCQSASNHSTPIHSLRRLRYRGMVPRPRRSQLPLGEVTRMDGFHGGLTAGLSRLATSLGGAAPEQRAVTYVEV